MNPQNHDSLKTDNVKPHNHAPGVVGNVIKFNDREY